MSQRSTRRLLTLWGFPILFQVSHTSGLTIDEQAVSKATSRYQLNCTKQARATNCEMIT